MMKDQIKSYNIWECFNSKCYSCFKSSHLVDKCPMIQYIPDRDLLIRKFNYSAIQNRNNNPKINIKKKKYNALGHLVATQISAFRISRKIVFDENENPEQSFSDEDEVHCESSHLKKKKSNEVNSLEYLLEKVWIKIKNIINFTKGKR